MYREMHEKGERFLGIAPQATFDGRSLAPQAPRIKRLIERTGATTILDYGSGKGQQYDPGPLKVKGEGEWEGVIDYWGVDEVICFDPAYLPYSELPTGTFDGVISTDVLEHCPEEDVPWIVEEMFSFADKFLFATVACYPANCRMVAGAVRSQRGAPPRRCVGSLGHVACRRRGKAGRAMPRELN